jgi:hypothetical protein
VRPVSFSAPLARSAGFRRDRPGDSFRGWLYGITRNGRNGSTAATIDAVGLPRFPYNAHSRRGVAW